MTGGVDRDGTGATVADQVVDDSTYDLVQALASKLETIEAYEQYLANDERSPFIEILADERRHATLLLEALRTRL